jgi:Flp pilus assembly protein TadB
MSPLPTAAVVALIMAVAVVALVHGLRPQRRSLAQVRTLLYPTEVARPTHTTNGHRAIPGVAAVSAPLAGWIDRTMGEALRFVSLDGTALASRMVAAAIVVMFGVACAAASAVALGILPASPMWLILAIGTGAMCGWFVFSDVQHRVERRRREFGRTANDFVQLVAVGLTTDQSIEEAIQFALSVGDSDMFELLRTELATAPLRGVPMWEALDQLGRRFQRRELSELGNSIERQGTQGVSITETVTTLATAMRERNLDDLERQADKVNANLAGPTICFVVTTIVFLAYPLAIRIGGAFGG